MTSRLLSFSLLFVFCVPASGCGLHGQREVVPRKPPTPEAALEQPARIVAPGVVESWGGEVALAPEEQGRIAELLIEEGEPVEAGRLLAVLDDRVERAAVEVARAQLAEAEAAWAKTLSGATAEELRTARAEAEADDARASLALATLERMNRLGAAEAAAAAEVERADAEARAQSAAARASSARLGSVTRGARAEDRGAARARLDAARGRLHAAEASLARRRVVAPRAGSVLLSPYHVGELFTPGGAPLLVLGDVSRLRIRMEVDEIDALRVVQGAPCTLYGDDSVRITEGQVFRIAPKMGRRRLAIESPTARADVRVREVFVEVPASASLIPGQRVWGHTSPRT
jgi:multidrug resistance efflux pump